MVSRDCLLRGNPATVLSLSHTDRLTDQDSSRQTYAANVIGKEISTYRLIHVSIAKNRFSQNVALRPGPNFNRLLSEPFLTKTSELIPEEIHYYRNLLNFCLFQNRHPAPQARKVELFERFTV
jgi:hypothetical protein